MFTPYKRKTDRKQIAAYLGMLEYAANRQNNIYAIVQKTSNNPLIMENKQTDSANANNAQNGEKTPTNGGFSFARQFNKVTFSVDVTDFEYCKLAALYDAKNPNTVYRLDGIWINKSPLGEAPVFIVSEIAKMVNIPSHQTATAREILNNSDAVNAIKDGKVGFTVYEYEARGKKCYNVRFTDL